MVSVVSKLLYNEKQKKTKNRKIFSVDFVITLVGWNRICGSFIKLNNIFRSKISNRSYVVFFPIFSTLVSSGASAAEDAQQ